MPACEESLRLRIRRETRDLHERLENELLFPGSDLTRTRHEDVLRRFYGFYVPWEANLKPWTEKSSQYETRMVCDLWAQSISRRLNVEEQHTELEDRLRLNSLTTRLLGLMTQEEEFLDGLRKHPDQLLEFARAGGAAVVYSDECSCIGDCPPEDGPWRIVDFLVESGREEIFHTDALPGLLSKGEAYREKATGVLAISISKIHRSYLERDRSRALPAVDGI